MSDSNSVSKLLHQVQEGESFAAHQLWSRFIGQLINAARKHLRSLPRRAVDEEDVAISAFDAFLRGAKEGRFKQLETREDLWAVLAMLTERKAVGVLRKELAEKRGAGQIRGESVFEQMLGQYSGHVGIAQPHAPAPSVVEAFTLEVRELLDALKDDKLREIALLKMEGYKNREIAERLDSSLRAIERKLQLIRSKWREKQ